MVLSHRGYRGGGHESGRPFVSPLHSLVLIALHLDIPSGRGGACPALLIRNSLAYRYGHLRLGHRTPILRQVPYTG